MHGSWSSALVLLSSAFRLGLAQDGTAHVAGRVSDLRGKAVLASVTAYAKQVVDGNEIILVRCATTTQADGKYDCPNLPVGTYLIAASPIAAKVSSASSKFFAPGTTALEDADSIALISGSMAWADVHIKPVPGVALRGRLNPLAPEAALSLFAIDGDGLSLETDKRISYNGKTGTFEIKNVPPGHYVLRGSWLVDNEEHLSSVAIEVQSLPIENIRMQAIPNVVITGSLATGSGPVILSVNLSRKDGMIPTLSTEVQKGSFLFPIVPAGEYSLSVVGSGAYIASITSGSKRFDGDTFTTAGQPLTELEVGIGYPALSLHGSVEQVQSKSSADIVVVSEQTGTLYHVMSDPQRRFSIAGLAPGAYRLFAWSHSSDVPFRLLSFLKKNSNGAVEVDLSTSSAASDLSLSLIEPRR